MTVRTIRQYVPAYRADNGNVIPIGSTTVSAHFAEIEAESLRSPEDETEVFVAYRDQPVWQPVELTEGTNMNKPRADPPVYRSWRRANRVRHMRQVDDLIEAVQDAVIDAINTLGVTLVGPSFEQITVSPIPDGEVAQILGGVGPLDEYRGQ